MWLDNTIQFSSAQTLVTTATTTLVSTTTYDVTGAGVGVASGMITGVLGSTGAVQTVGFDIGAGDGMAIPEIVWTLPVGVQASAGGTLQVKLQAAPDNGSNVPGTYTDLYISKQFTGSELVANFGGQFQVPPVTNDYGESYPRFYRLAYIIGTATFSGATITSNMVINPSQPTKLQSYPGNYTA